VKLLVTRPSPYARKGWAAVLELGLGDRVAIEELPARMPTTPKPDLEAVNPLGKVPTLLRDGAHPIVDSRVIVAFLDAMAGGGRLIPAEAEARWSALTLEAIADGMMDAGVVVRMEALQPEGQRRGDEVSAYLGKIARACDRLEREPPAAEFHVGQLALACAIDWLRFRALGPDPLAGRPRLADWHASLADRPCLAATRPA
jgi:glutathione S-transferase